MSAPIPGPDDQQPGRGFADGLPPGLDYQALLDAMAASGVLDCDEDDLDAEFAAWDAAAAQGRLVPADPAQVEREQGSLSCRGFRTSSVPWSWPAGRLAPREWLIRSGSTSWP